MNNTEQQQQFRTVLAPDKLRCEAQENCGLQDYGDTTFFASMDRLMERAITEVQFTEAGLHAYRDDAIRHLVNRLRTQDDIKKHPEILDEDVSDPLIIIGLPRSGTTKLQRMMAADPNIQKLYMWQMWNPARFPDAVEGEPDPRMAAVGVGVGTVAIEDGEAAQAQALAQAAHATAMAAVEEEFVFFDLILDESVTGFNTNIPLVHYQDLGVDKPDKDTDRNAYDYVKQLLQYRQWQNGGRQNKPWLLKAVIHHTHMDSLCKAFPHAKFIHCHRDPLDTIPSLTKMMWAVWSTKATVDKKYAGQEFLQWSSLGIKRYMKERERLNLDDRILDIPYPKIRDGIMPLIEQAYQLAGWELTDEARRLMLQWENDNEQGKHGKHSYSPEEFGLSEAMINDAFADYIERFIQR